MWKKVMWKKTMWKKTGGISLQGKIAHSVSCYAAAAVIAVGIGYADKNAIAQQSGGISLEEVIVTAQKREESLQDVSISVSAFTQNSLDKQGVSDIFGLINKVPSMQLQAPNGVIWGFMRGTGNSNPTAGGDNSLAFHYDGVYMGFSTAAMIDMWDVSRVEILRGPQGTLYGRNATGGTINVIPQKPAEDFGFNADITAGSDELYRVRGMINPGRKGIFSSRAAFSYTVRDGFQENLEPGFDNTDEDDSWMLRLIGAVELGAEGTLGVTLLGSETDAAVSSPIRPGDSYPGFYAPFVPNPKPTDPRKVRKDVDENNEFETYGITAQLDYGFGDVALKAIAAYYEVDRLNHSDWDGSEIDHLDFTDSDSVEQSSLEIQFLSQNWERGSWILGANWFEMDNRRSNDILVGGFFADVPGFPLPPLRVVLLGEMEALSYAVFGHLTYDLTDQLKLTVGARYAWDEKESVATNYQGPQAIFGTPAGAPLVRPGGFDEEWSEPLGKIALDYSITEDSMVYASISRGYKAGGFSVNGLSAADSPTGLEAAEPELVLSYEIGTKNRFFDNRLELNASIYLAQYEDIQQAKFFPGAFAPGFFNVGDGDAFGVELEWQGLVSERFRVDGNVGYIKTEYDGSLEFNMATCGVAPPFTCLPAENIEGNQFISTPEWSVSFGVEYEVPLESGTLVARADWSHKSKTYYTLFEDNQRSQPAYDQFDFRLIFEGDSNWSAEVFVQNATDEDVIHTMFSGSSLLGSDSPLVWYQPPRTFGIKIGYSM